MIHKHSTWLKPVPHTVATSDLTKFRRNIIFYGLLRYIFREGNMFFYPAGLFFCSVNVGAFFSNCVGWHIAASHCCKAHSHITCKYRATRRFISLIFSHRILNIIHETDDMSSLQNLFNTSLVTDFGNVFQLLGEWSMQGLRWDLQPVGDVCSSVEHVFKGHGLFSDSAPEDASSRSPGGVKMRKKQGQMLRETQ